MSETPAPSDWTLTADDREVLADLDIGMDTLGDLPDIDLGDLALGTDIEPQRYRPAPRPKVLHPRLIKYERAEEAAAACLPLAEGERVHCVTPGTFIFGDFLEALAVQNDWLVRELWIGTLSLSGANIASLANLFQGDYLRHLHLLVADVWYSGERGRNGLVEYAYDELDQPDPAPDTPAADQRSFQLSITTSHAKVALIDTAAGEQYVIHGSANMPSSASVEMFTMERDPALFSFHREWLLALEELHATINHAIPNPRSHRVPPKRQQWQAISPAAPTAAPTTPAPARPTRAKPVQ